MLTDGQNKQFNEKLARFYNKVGNPLIEMQRRLSTVLVYCGRTRQFREGNRHLADPSSILLTRVHHLGCLFRIRYDLSILILMVQF